MLPLVIVFSFLSGGWRIGCSRFSGCRFAGVTAAQVARRVGLERDMLCDDSIRHKVSARDRKHHDRANQGRRCRCWNINPSAKRTRSETKQNTIDDFVHTLFILPFPKEQTVARSHLAQRYARFFIKCIGCRSKCPARASACPPEGIISRRRMRPYSKSPIQGVTDTVRMSATGRNRA